MPRSSARAEGSLSYNYADYSETAGRVGVHTLGILAKQDIGAIRVFDAETRFEVRPEAAEKFAALVAERKKGGVRIFPAPDGLEGYRHTPAPDANPREKPKRPFHKHPKHKAKKRP